MSDVDNSMVPDCYRYVAQWLVVVVMVDDPYAGCIHGDYLLRIFLVLKVLKVVLLLLLMMMMLVVVVVVVEMLNVV